MKALRQWLTSQLEDKLVEPNSRLGKSVQYLLTHWTALTLFLRQPGAPLDNNICERALKKVVLHRKNALFYRTMNGAAAGDLFMSLIHTCELNGVNAFNYLTELQRHPVQIRANPGQWMPWNYSAQVNSQPPEGSRARLPETGRRHRGARSRLTAPSWVGEPRRAAPRPVIGVN